MRTKTTVGKETKGDCETGGEGAVGERLRLPLALFILLFCLDQPLLFQNLDVFW